MTRRTLRDEAPLRDGERFHVKLSSLYRSKERAWGPRAQVMSSLESEGPWNGQCTLSLRAGNTSFSSLYPEQPRGYILSQKKC